jgi:hypothetical protein
MPSTLSSDQRGPPRVAASPTPVDAVGEAELDDDVALGGDREAGELVPAHRGHVDDGGADLRDAEIAREVGRGDGTVFHGTALSAAVGMGRSGSRGAVPAGGPRLEEG